MTSLVLALVKLLSAVRRGMMDPEFRALLVFLLTLLTSAVIFYTTVERWSVIDALYFSVITMATIGYGDLVPTTPLSKVFTMVYALVSVGIFVGIVTKVGALLLERERSRLRQLRRKVKAGDRQDASGADE